MNKIQIIKGDTPPALKSRLSSKNYPFADMGVGDHFEVKMSAEELKKFAVMVFALGKRTARKYSLESIYAGVKVWRLV